MGNKCVNKNIIGDNNGKITLAALTAAIPTQCRFLEPGINDAAFSSAAQSPSPGVWSEIRKLIGK